MDIDKIFAASEKMNWTIQEISESDLLNELSAQGATIPSGTPAPPFSSGVSQPLQPILQQPNQINIGGFIDAEFAVEIADNILSSGCVLAMGAVNVGVKKTAFVMSAKEKQLMQKPMEEVLKLLNMQVTNPYEMMLVAIVAIYVPKMAIAYINHAPADKPAKRQETTQNNIIKRRHNGKPDTCLCPKCVEARNT